MTESLAVFAPSPVLTITIEPGSPRPAVHLHAGGQGFWVARLAATLGADVTLCCALGGETGRVLRSLIEAEPITLASTAGNTANGVYIHDRRVGERVEIVNVDSAPLDRHAADALYGIAMTTGLDADITLLTGCRPSPVVDPDLYRRLVADLRANDGRVIADLTGPALEAALSSGLELLKLSQDEIVAEGYAREPTLEALTAAARDLHSRGALTVAISRAAAPTIVVTDDEEPVVLILAGPRFQTLDERGTGDSMFAATGVGLARGLGVIEALQLGMAAGALNATRRGLGTGSRHEIERLARHIHLLTAS